MSDDHPDPGGQGCNDRLRVGNACGISEEKTCGQPVRQMITRKPDGISELACGARGMLHRVMTSTGLTAQIAENRQKISAAISENAEHDVELIAVSKRQPDDRLQAALDCGHRVFGENRVQEAQEHWAHRRDIDGLRLHLIGPLQSNKSEDAVALFDVIQTVDRPKIVRTLSEAANKLGRFPDLFIQVNTGEEEQKAGVSPADTASLVELVRDTYPGKLLGLMCIPPVDEPAGPHFALLSKIAQENGLKALSMGMSADYELACRYGATHVRVGSAFFGERDS
ncbi:YggS family pyridoxal phosphate-dependent enzyme [Henriciella sp. AS95]|uniref:YggS family pyridoxal phosphate-dependent enzyme n=1 Tax=Henriciella sp. AS95 TaxID=3135782 RepID=UPI00316BE5AD